MAVPEILSPPFALSLTPVKTAALPHTDSILAAGHDLINSTIGWKEGKTFDGVRTFINPNGPGGSPWHCRLSVHPPEELTFDQIWNKMSKDKALTEKEYIPEVKKVTLIKEISPIKSIWSMLYTFPLPLSSRSFTLLQVFNATDSSPRTGIVISIPIDLSSPGDEDLAKLEEVGVKGRFVSLERFVELEDGKLEWRMATSTAVGGNVPTFLIERSMPSSVAEDVPNFIKWFHSLPEF